MNEARELESRALELCNDERFSEALPLFEAAVALFRAGQFPFELADCLTHLATCLDAVGRRRDALAAFEEALPLAREQSDLANLPSCLMNMANCLDRLGRHGEAYPLYLEALELDRAGDSPDTLATTLMNLANCLDLQNRHEEALPLHREALEIAREVWSPEDLSLCLMHITQCLMDMREQAEAAALFDELLPLARQYAGPGHLSERLHEAASCHVEMEQWEQALALYREAIEIDRSLGMHGNLTRALMNAANCLDYLERHDEARTYYEEALPLARIYRSPPDLAKFLSNYASCLDDLAQWNAGQPLHDEALALYRADGAHPGGMARCLLNSAKALGEQGSLESALARFDEALALYEAGAPGDRVLCLINSASCLNRLGRYSEASTRFEEALARIGERPATSTLLRRAQMGLAISREHLGAHNEALALYDAAVANALADAQPGEQATYLMNSASCLQHFGRYREALARYEMAIPRFRERRLPADLARCLINMGICQLDLGQRADARASYAEAATLLASAGPEADDDRCFLLTNRANERRTAGDLNVAWEFISAAIPLAEGLAGKIVDQMNRTGIRSKLLTPFQLGTWLAIARNDPDSAFAIAQRAKGRTLTELLETRGELTSLDRQELLLRQQHELGFIGDDAIATGIAHIQRQRRDKETSRLGVDPRQPVDLATIVAALRPGEALVDALEVMTDGTLALFLLLPEQQDAARVSLIAGVQLRPLVDAWNSARARYLDMLQRYALNRGLRDTLEAQVHEENRALERLGALLLTPLLPLLEATGVTTIIFSPGGLLHQLPLAALRIPDDRGRSCYLIDRFDLHLVPTASSIAILRRPGAPRITWPPALLAAAPFNLDDPGDHDSPTMPASSPDRIIIQRNLVRSGETGNLELRASGKEILTIGQHIRALDPTGPAPRLFFGAEATRQALLPEIPAARLVHLATHGERLTEGKSLLDYTIRLADDERGCPTRITVGEIYDGGITLDNVFAVCLSACHLGEVVTMGAEALGFAQAFLSAGAGIILAPIWAVNDDATAKLMESWYQALSGGDRPAVAAAWRIAARTLRNERTLYEAPYFWAGFLPNGDGALRLVRPYA